MKTKFFTFLLALIVGAGTMHAATYNGTCGENLTWDLTDGVLTISGTGSMYGYSNHSPSPWSLYQSSIKSAVLKEGVTNIGQMAFNKCTSLTSVTIGNSVTSIGNDAFLHCTSLASIIIPDNVTSIGNDAFSGCSSLTSVIIGNSVTSIGNGAFNGCTNLTSINIPNSVTGIGQGVFFGCSSLIAVTIPNGTIGSSAFNKCTSLTSVTFGEGVIIIGQYPFTNCTSLALVTVEAQTPPATHSSLDISCPIYVPCGTLDAYQSSWYYEASLIRYKPLDFTVTGGVNDGTMGEVIVPLTSCDDTLLTAIPYFGCYFVKWSDGNTDNPRKFVLTQDTTFTAEFAQNTSGQCGDKLSWTFSDGQLSITGSGDMYSYNQNTVPWLHLKPEIKTVSCSPEMTSISDYAFSGINTSKFNTIILPTNLVTIGSHAFDGDSFLEKVDFGASLEYIGNYAFRGCTRILTMTCWAEFTPNVEWASLTDISDYAELYVLPSAFRKFEVDNNWNRFILKEIGANKTTGDVTDIVIVPDDNSANIVWPAVAGAATYELGIKDKDGNTICTLIFNAEGVIVQISFAPSRGEAPQRTQTAGFAFTVTGLESGTEYDLTITAKNASGATLDVKTLSFRTDGSEAVETISGDKAPKTTKLIRDGQLLILRGDKTYTLTGQEVK